MNLTLISPFCRANNAAAMLDHPVPIGPLAVVGDASVGPFARAATEGVHWKEIQRNRRLWRYARSWNAFLDFAFVWHHDIFFRNLFVASTRVGDRLFERPNDHCIFNHVYGVGCPSFNDDLSVLLFPSVIRDANWNRFRVNFGLRAPVSAVIKLFLNSMATGESHWKTVNLATYKNCFSG